MAELVKVELKNLFRTENSGGGVFLGNDEKTFAIFIGPGELNALILAGGGISAPRPLTHNLLDMILAGFEIEVRSVVISDLVDDAFHAILTLAQGSHEVVIDCRPSDALVVAVMRKKEVYVTRELFEKVEDGDVLLSAMKEELKRAKLEDEGKAKKKPRKSSKKKKDEAEEPEADAEEEASSPGSPEGELGDVREIPGIDWSSLDKK
ncbi:MAG TPA: bifunctional nuclease family protein [Planctomycetota bacterium]|nr:bifunctional nuclease family protein [Planctomycetota bacterium]